MEKILLSLDEASALIKSGRFLSLAADEALLRRLPRGNWIGGSIPYFIGAEGGVQSRERIHVTDLADSRCQAYIKEYTTDTIQTVAKDAPENGYTILIVPAGSELHRKYAAEAQGYEDLFMKPIVGWISGVHLDDLGKVAPIVINGKTGDVSSTGAIALHVPLPANQMAVVRILNLFKQGEGDTLTFPQDGFSATDCWVNGQPANFAAYVQERKLDLSRPLVADYNGAQINISFQGVDADQGRVDFYAPVFAGIEYKQAAPVGDYAKEFSSLVAGAHFHVQFSCNCILNYLFGKLEGKKTGDFTGPVTFGEIGYQLLNQTMVYLEILES